jgi:hypothetical protein
MSTRILSVWDRQFGQDVGVLENQIKAKIERQKEVIKTESILDAQLIAADKAREVLRQEELEFRRRHRQEVDKANQSMSRATLLDIRNSEGPFGPSSFREFAGEKDLPSTRPQLLHNLEEISKERREALAILPELKKIDADIIDKQKCYADQIAAEELACRKRREHQVIEQNRQLVQEKQRIADRVKQATDEANKIHSKTAVSKIPHNPFPCLPLQKQVEILKDLEKQAVLKKSEIKEAHKIEKTLDKTLEKSVLSRLALIEEEEKQFRIEQERQAVLANKILEEQQAQKRKEEAKYRAQGMSMTDGYFAGFGISKR